jgi:hypothetical protein
MRANEKQMMIDTYKQQFKHFLVSNGSDFERLQLDGMKTMLKLFFSDMEIMSIENSVRVTSKYAISHFESIESWLRQIEKEQGITAVPFSWDNKGLDKIEMGYDFLFTEYKGFKTAFELAYKAINKEAA